MLPSLLHDCLGPCISRPVSVEDMPYHWLHWYTKFPKSNHFISFLFWNTFIDGLKEGLKKVFVNSFLFQDTMAIMSWTPTLYRLNFWKSQIRQIASKSKTIIILMKVCCCLPNFICANSFWHWEQDASFGLIYLYCWILSECVKTEHSFTPQQGYELSFLNNYL